MSFHPDPNKQAKEISFIRKSNKIKHLPVTISKSTVNHIASQKRLGVVLDSSISFDKHLIGVQSLTNETIGFLHKLQNTLPRQTLITIYEVFVRPHLDYGDILYDWADNA